MRPLQPQRNDHDELQSPGDGSTSVNGRVTAIQEPGSLALFHPDADVLNGVVPTNSYASIPSANGGVHAAVRSVAPLGPGRQRRRFVQVWRRHSVTYPLIAVGGELLTTFRGRHPAKGRVHKIETGETEGDPNYAGVQALERIAHHRRRSGGDLAALQHRIRCGEPHQPAALRRKQTLARAETSPFRFESSHPLQLSSRRWQTVSKVNRKMLRALVFNSASAPFCSRARRTHCRRCSAMLSVFSPVHRQNRPCRVRPSASTRNRKSRTRKTR
jgi:hypothetical protein